ncbi:MAG: DsbA family protein [Myxococcales bacterium]
MAEQSSLVRLQKTYELDLDWRGFELHPETPRGGMPLSALFPASAIPAMHERLRRFAASRGLPDFRASERLCNTRRALAACEHARDQGKLFALREALMKAYWERGEDVESDTVLRRAASEAGLDPETTLAAADAPAFLARVEAMRAEAEERGVTGIPTFFIGDEVIVGAQPYEALAEAVERAGGRPRRGG